MCFPGIFIAFLSFFPGISSFSSTLILSFPPPSSFSHPSDQHYSSMGAVAMQIKCCNPEAKGCSGCMLVCVHMHGCLQRTGCSWVSYNMATAVVYDRCSIPHPLSIIISTAIIILIAPSSQFWRGEGAQLSQWWGHGIDSVLIQENSSWMKEGEGERRLESLNGREKNAVIGGNTIQKNWLRQRERELGKGRDITTRFITASSTLV